MRKPVIYALIAGALVAAFLLFAGCGSNADVVSDNISKEAEKFNIERRIVGINGITDKVEFEVTGKCSLEYGETMASTLDVICKDGPHEFSKHYIKMSDNMFYISTQLQGADVSEFHTKIILKPQNIVPDLDLVTE